MFLWDFLFSTSRPAREIIGRAGWRRWGRVIVFVVYFQISEKET